MDEKIKELINKSVETIINNNMGDKKIFKIVKKHDEKIHFIPKRYRSLGGILQSMNIQFGNFLELLMKNLIENEDRYEIIEKYSGKKSNKFKISSENDKLIDLYITNCQTKDMELELEFEKLKKNLFENKATDYVEIKHDIDLLFKDKKTNKIYYLELKYNDDHDTGKFTDINRKIIKTYAYLINEFDIKNYNDIVPILFYFTNKKMKGNIYLPEKTNIKRGKKFFEEFLSIDYDTLDNYLYDFSESPENVKKFDNIYKKIMSITYIN